MCSQLYRVNAHQNRPKDTVKSMGLNPKYFAVFAKNTKKQLEYLNWFKQKFLNHKTYKRGLTRTSERPFFLIEPLFSQFSISSFDALRLESNRRSQQLKQVSKMATRAVNRILMWFWIKYWNFADSGASQYHRSTSW